VKFTTFYFSGTGNTEWAVNQFKQIVTERGHDSEIISIDNLVVQKTSFFLDIVRNSDFIGFANPIYGANIPPIMKDFIDKFIKMSADEKECSKQVYIINTFAYVNGFGPICAKKLFSNTGFKLIAYVNLQICNNISTPKLKINRIDQIKLNKRKIKAKENLNKMVGMLLEGKRYITGIGPYLIPNILVRKKSIKAIVNNYKVFKVDIAVCKKCMLCVNKCPTKSIEYKDNDFRFLSTCTACMRCYNNCPTCSILFGGLYADPNTYERYHGSIVLKD
jgi:NAD-dependent dihydropyrimidine dehydrogenase PreA subunit